MPIKKVVSWFIRTCHFLQVSQFWWLHTSLWTVCKLAFSFSAQMKLMNVEWCTVVWRVRVPNLMAKSVSIIRNDVKKHILTYIRDYLLKLKCKNWWISQWARSECPFSRCFFRRNFPIHKCPIHECWKAIFMWKDPIKWQSMRVICSVLQMIRVIIWCFVRAYERDKWQRIWKMPFAFNAISHNWWTRRALMNDDTNWDMWIKFHRGRAWMNRWWGGGTSIFVIRMSV